MLIMPPSPCFWAKLRKKKAQIAKKTTIGTIQDRRVPMKLLSVVPRNLTLYFARSEASSVLDALRYEIDLAVLERRFEFSLDPVLMDDHFLDLPVLEVGLELAVGDLLVGRRRRDKLKQKQSSECRCSKPEVELGLLIHGEPLG